MTASKSTLESVKTIEIKSDVIDRLAVGAYVPETDGKRFHLFVKLYNGKGTTQAAGMAFDSEEDALNAQKLLHNVVNEVLA